MVDLKGDFPAPWSRYHVMTRPDRRSDWLHNHIIYRPHPDYRNAASNTYFMRKVWNLAERRVRRKGFDRWRKPFILYIDEGLFYSNTGAKHWLSNLAVGGRSLELGLWVASQRPITIPVEVRTEAWRWYVFALSFDDDIREVVKYTKGDISVRLLEALRYDYSFYEIKRGEHGTLQVRHMPPLQVAA